MLRLFCERRVQPERYYVAEDEESMRVPKDVLECVAFIYCHFTGHKKPSPIGTVFFIKLLDDAKSEAEPKFGWTYAVTARHLLDKIIERSTDKIVHVRFNERGGTARLIPTSVYDWVSHPTDSAVDVAVLPFEIPYRDFDIKSFVLDGTLIPEKVPFGGEPIHYKGQKGRFPAIPADLGDEVFLPGLFVDRVGDARNHPIVRIGNIAALAGEPIETPFGKVTVHLIEARSIGGLSGSPVFVNMGQMRKVGNMVYFSTDTGPVFHLFGLIHGHWDEKDPIVKKINMGIAMVVPMKKIFEVLRQPKLAEQRAREKEEHMAKKNMPTLDSAQVARSVVEAAIGEPLTRPKKSKKTARKAKKRAPK